MLGEGYEVAASAIVISEMAEGNCEAEKERVVSVEGARAQRRKR